MYQTMSAENLGSSSVRKTNTNNFKSSREDHQNGVENGRIASTSGNVTPAATTTTTSTSFEGNGVIHKSPPKINQQNESNHHHQSAASSSSAVQQSHESSPSRSSVCLGGGGSGDMLLQWGQNKRSRCSRTESRSMVSVVLEKHNTNSNNPIMPPPPPHPNSNPIPPSLPSTSTSNGSRSGGFSNGSRSGGFTRGRAHGLLYTKDTPFSTKNRNLVDQMGTHSASPSRNGGGSSRPISRSTVGKRSPSCTEKKDKKVSSSGAIRKVKSDDSLAPPTSNGNHHLELAHGDQEHGGGGGGGRGGGDALMTRFPVADTDKGGNEVVEWPRIYLSLSRKEKEDDFYAMKGTKLPHRPKKRAKAVDRALQYCFPGLWLSDLTRARYEVRERKSAKKPKRRGLKGLETVESESE